MQRTEGLDLGISWDKDYKLQLKNRHTYAHVV